MTSKIVIGNVVPTISVVLIKLLSSGFAQSDGADSFQVRWIRTHHYFDHFVGHLVNSLLTDAQMVLHVGSSFVFRAEIEPSFKHCSIFTAKLTVACNAIKFVYTQQALLSQNLTIWVKLNGTKVNTWLNVENKQCRNIFIISKHNGNITTY